MMKIEPSVQEIQPGKEGPFRVVVDKEQLHGATVTWGVLEPDDLTVKDGELPQPVPPSGFETKVRAGANTPGGRYRVFAVVKRDGDPISAGATVIVPPLAAPAPEPTTPNRGVVTVQMKRSRKDATPDTVLWSFIRNATQMVSFDQYRRFMDRLLIEGSAPDPLTETALNRSRQGERALLRGYLPGADPYKLIKKATDAFLVVNSGALPKAGITNIKEAQLNRIGAAEESRLLRRGLEPSGESALALWNSYVAKPEGAPDVAAEQGILPYLSIIFDNLGEGPAELQNTIDQSGLDDWKRVVYERLSSPCMIELIWNYWHEEGMLVQTMASISQRFQNRRAFNDREPLGQLEIDPLRPLGRILWGYVDDETHRLSVLRRAHEYEHHYGFTLHGKAVRGLRPVERRSKFLESFHNLLYRCVQFFYQDDDATVIADGFPVLNAVKETHYLLAQGAHNQFGDLPWQARREMLMEQWILSRPEMREFVGGRVMVPYPEAWMDRVDAVKGLQGWTDVSVVHFHDLAVFGEQLLLSVRYGGWSQINEPDFAANWARYWRAEIQGYVHGYRAATGVDLSADVTDGEAAAARYIPPSVHLRQRLELQARR